MGNQVISSLQNPLVKEVVKLGQKPGERKKSGLFIVEGVREVSLAMQAGIELVKLIVCQEIYRADKGYPINMHTPNVPVIQVEPAVYAKMAYRGNAEGVIAILKKFNTSLETVKLSAKPLVLVLESVEKPGNLGAILRTADAAAVDGVIICDPLTDVFNPNVIRSSLGCVFSVKIAVCDREMYFDWAKKNAITTMVASVQANEPYFRADMNQPLALVFGTEADGLSPEWYDQSDVHLKIPMEGMIDSLNVSASAAIMIFEAKRQRMSND